jgi:hypothetical protein
MIGRNRQAVRFRREVPGMGKLTLLYTPDMERAKAEIASVSGHVTQIFTPILFEASLPDDFPAKKLRHSSLEPSRTLDEASQMLADAWRAIDAGRKSAARALVEEKPIPWDDPRFKPPGRIGAPPFPGTRGANKAESIATATSVRMVGSVTVGLVVVSGNTPALTFSGAEQIQVVQQVMQALQFLASEAPLGNLTFVYEIHFLTINATENSTCNAYETCEAVWRDPALAKLGHPIGVAGCAAYANALKANHKTDWSYVAFFTKYRQYWFGYAGGARLCMQYSNGGWGPGQIDRVFAHETCHIFGAADEYGSCHCWPSGELQVPNKNCQNCTSAPVDCLMKANTFSLCYWTRGQIGWWPRVAAPMGAVTVDADRPYAFVTGQDGHLWMNWWSGTTWNWSNQGLPPGVSIAASMGACTYNINVNNVDVSRPHVFVKGSDKNLWENSWSGSAWSWTNRAQPTGTTIAATMGAITVNGRPQIFVKGGDDNLWVNGRTAGGWTWVNHGKPPSASIVASMGTITVGGNRPYVFVTGSDGRMWLRWLSGTAWAWANQGKPPFAAIAASMGAVAVNGTRPYVFANTKDGDLWVNWWSGTTWHWTNQGKPPGTTIAASMGATIVDLGRPFVFFRGGDGNLWLHSWSGADGWSWANLGMPPGDTVDVAMGAITVSVSRPHVFVKGVSGDLWLNAWSGTAWSWTRLSAH